MHSNTEIVLTFCVPFIGLLKTDNTLPASGLEFANDFFPYEQGRANKLYMFVSRLLATVEAELLTN